MKFENTQTFNWEGAFRGLRNPMDSWNKSDSFIDDNDKFMLGNNDVVLAQRMIKGGTEQSKFLRQIGVSVDITAPLYWINEFTTYKIGTTMNSCSIQHTLTKKQININMFSFDDERIYDILGHDKTIDMNKYKQIYPYETNEYKEFEVNDRHYKIYRNGRVISEPFTYIDSHGTGRIRTFGEKEKIFTQNRNGYWYANFGGRKGERWLLHRLVATSFINNPENKPCINHKDGNKGNNSVENLEWVTYSENENHALSNGLNNPTELWRRYKSFKGSSKLNISDREEIRNMYKTGTTQTELADLFNISQSQISEAICDENRDEKELFEKCWFIENNIKYLERLRNKYNETKNYNVFRELRQSMPMNFNYLFTETLNYAVIRNQIHQRYSHRLKEWSTDFINWCHTLPYSKELLFYCNGDDKN